jgi:heme/copper-type cytochrome/quinol oxidase subunit 3
MAEAVHPPRDPAASAWVGMAIVLGAWTVLFAALLLAYAVVRTEAPLWPPPGLPRLPRGALAVNTMVLAAASLALRGAVSAARRAESARVRPYLAGALVLGAGFLALQVLVWHGLVARGLSPRSGVYGSVFFALSGFHAAHVLAGLVVLVTVAARGLRLLPLRLTLAYWDFMLVVWAVLYIAVCVL